MESVSLLDKVQSEDAVQEEEELKAHEEVESDQLRNSCEQQGERRHEEQKQEEEALVVHEDKKERNEDFCSSTPPPKDSTGANKEEGCMGEGQVEEEKKEEVIFREDEEVKVGHLKTSCSSSTSIPSPEEEHCNETSKEVRKKQLEEDDEMEKKEEIPRSPSISYTPLPGTARSDEEQQESIVLPNSQEILDAERGTSSLPDPTDEQQLDIQKEKTPPSGPGVPSRGAPQRSRTVSSSSPALKSRTTPSLTKGLSLNHILRLCSTPPALPACSSFLPPPPFLLRHFLSEHWLSWR